MQGAACHFPRAEGGCATKNAPAGIMHPMARRIETNARSLITEAVAILRRGGLVAFPTETVYGLGADAANAQAIARVFAAKGRPGTNPLIVHVADARRATRYAAVWPDTAQTLSREFWPGPLTLVVPKGKTIVAQVTAGLETVGLRAPDHPLTLRLLDEFDGPLAGPSANPSTRVSPTTAAHVRRQLASRVDLILDGGPCRIGIESTVLDLTTDVPRILRPGMISRAQIEQVIGPVQVAAGHTDDAAPASSPGQHKVHYAPRAKAYRFDRQELDRVEAWCAAHTAEPWVMLILQSTPHDPHSARHIALPAEPQGYAARLYQAFHAIDEAATRTLFVEMPPDQPAWSALRDRLLRATVPLPPFTS